MYNISKIMNQNISIGAIFKNEADIIEEWILHHLSVGVEHFYLINDNSDDNYIDVLDKYKKYITLNHSNNIPYYYGRQHDIYNIHFKKHLKDTKWIAILDIDEYLWSPYEKNLNNILNKIPNNINGINVWSVCFGSNGHIHQPNEIIKSFTFREELPKKEDSIYRNIHLFKILECNLHKQILRAAKVNRFYVHQNDFEARNKDGVLCSDFFNIKNNLFRINHYRLQSKERWQKLQSKSDVNHYKPTKIYTLNSILELSAKDIDWIYKKTANDNYKNLNFLYDKLDNLYSKTLDTDLLFIP